jgi:hypothetical protein
MTSDTGSFSLKDELFNEEKVTWLARQFKTADKEVQYPEFPAALPRGLRFGKFENLRFSTILEA